MSNFFLCDMCSRKIAESGIDTVLCGWRFKRVGKKVMYDYGKGGQEGVYGYKEPTEVCKHYRPRSDG